MQRAQAVDDAAVRKNDFEAQDLLSCRAVADDVNAPRVRREVATDLAAAFRAQAQGKVAIDGTCCLLQSGEDTARLGDHRKIVRIDRTDPVQARQRQDQLTPGLVRYGATAKAGIAALGDDGDAGARAQPDDVCDLPGRARRDHDKRFPVQDIAPFRYMGLERLFVSHAVFLPDDSRKIPDKLIRRRQ